VPPSFTEKVELLPDNPPEEEDNISEISFTDILASQVQEDQQTHLDGASNVGGPMMMTWGTGFQKGLKLAADTPR
jgi:hypothetical protein